MSSSSPLRDRYEIAWRVPVDSPLFGEFARDPDPKVRTAIAWRVPLDSPLIAELARDPAESVRYAIAWCVPLDSPLYVRSVIRLREETL